MMPDLQAARASRRLYWLHTIAGSFAGLALAFSVFGFVRMADAITFAVLVAVIASLETLRVLVLSDRRPRR